ncbi:MAG: lysylphosphatidylglycerol synthase transmembrane domain-containing protein [Chloroflexi bacterium]|nr:lysylphosphatidylglycerol synthase transmembrane domain-containing protein [Chloroflexota bacterium]
MYAPYRSAYRQLVPGLLLAGIVLLCLMLLGNLNLVGLSLIKFKWVYFPLAVGLTFLSQTVRFLKRAVNFHQSGVRKVSFMESFRLFIASFPLAITPYRVGESFKGIWLFRASGIPVERGVSVFLVDQISDGLSVFVLIVVGILAFPTLWPLFASVFLAFLAATIFLKVNPLKARNSSSGVRSLEFARILSHLRNGIETNPALFTAGNLTVTLFLGILSWTVEGAALFFVLVGLGLPPSLPIVATAVLVFAFSTTVSLVTNLHGGLGVVELAMAIMLTLLLNFRPEIAVAATILFRLATFWTSFFIGMLLWSFSGKSLGLSSRESRIIES